MRDMHIHLKDGIIDQKIFDQYIKKCIALKLKEAVFLDHGNRISPKHISVLCSKEMIDKFNNKIVGFNNSKSFQQLQIIRGIEIDYSKDLKFRNETFEILKYGNFQWVVGAIHSMKFETLREYLEAIVDMLNNYNINVIAHIKLDNTFKNYEHLLLGIMKKCYRKKVLIEINTSDRSRWTDEQLYYMLGLMKRYNVNYVFSSDAHKVDDIGYMIKETMRKVEKWKKRK